VGNEEEEPKESFVLVFALLDQAMRHIYVNRREQLDASVYAALQTAPVKLEANEETYGWCLALISLGYAIALIEGHVCPSAKLHGN
jgi:hypothetical protein